MAETLLLMDKHQEGKFWHLIAGLGMLVYPTGFILTMLFWFMGVPITYNFLLFTMVTALAGVLYYFIVLLFFSHLFRRADFFPDQIPNYVILVSFLVSAVILFAKYVPDVTVFVGISGIYFTGFTLLCIGYYDKNRVRIFHLQKREGQIHLDVRIKYPLLGISRLVKGEYHRDFRAGETLKLVVVTPTTRKITRTFQLQRHYRVLTYDDIKILSANLPDPAGTQTPERYYTLSVLTSDSDRADSPGGIGGTSVKQVKDINTSQQAIVIKNNMTERQTTGVLEKIAELIPYEIIQNAYGMESKVDFFKISFQVIHYRK